MGIKTAALPGKEFTLYELADKKMFASAKRFPASINFEAGNMKCSQMMGLRGQEWCKLD